MLIKITDQCQMGCTHCLEDANPVGTFMSLDTFKKALEFTKRNDMSFIMISGGEPFEHPQLEEFVSIATKVVKVMILSNGLFINNEGLDRVNRMGVNIQITNDDRFYPLPVEDPKHPLITFVDRIQLVSPHGRAKKNALESSRMSPGCFNLRSIARGNSSTLRGAIATLRMYFKMCTPSITAKGDVVAGESRFCFKIGSLDDSDSTLFHNLANMKCNTCGLTQKLPYGYKEAIGEE